MGSLIRLRRAYAAHSNAEPNGAKELRPEVLTLRDRIDRLLAAPKSGGPGVEVSDEGKWRAAFAFS